MWDPTNNAPGFFALINPGIWDFLLLFIEYSAACTMRKPGNGCMACRDGQNELIQYGLSIGSKYAVRLLETVIAMRQAPLHG